MLGLADTAITNLIVTPAVSAIAEFSFVYRRL